LLLLFLLLYISGLTLRESRKKAASHQLYLTGELEREPGDSRQRLILTTPDAGSYILIGTKAEKLFAEREISRATVEGRIVRRGESASASAVVEVLSFRRLR
jgi:hypothetical protein